METGWLNIPWVVWGVMCLIVGGLYLVFVPGKAKIKGATGWRFVVLRWFHSFVWLALAISFFIRATPLEGLANLIALLGGILYAVYMGTFLQAMRNS